MRWIIDCLLLFIAFITAPVWLLRMAIKGKLRTDWKGRLGRGMTLPTASRRRVLIHAVSVGEVNAARLLVERLRAHEQVEVIVSVTTDTGFARAKDLFGADLPVVRYPFDFHFAVKRFLDRVRPSVVVLMELEVWPNFVAQCQARGISVCIVNGRLTERSARRYARIAGLIRPTFRRLAFTAVQTDAYRDRFLALDVPAERLVVTGTMKWDTARIADHVPGAEQLRAEMGIDPARPLITAGSTAPEEHALLRDAMPQEAPGIPEVRGIPRVQLLCAPRKPEWFDEAARELPGCARRSRHERGSASGRFLLDTIGELRQAYALADVVVIGRSFAPLFGSDMMEPIALGKATIVGPNVADFAETVRVLLEGDGLIQTTAAELPRVLRELLNDPARRAQLAENGRRIIRAHQGATDRHARLILDLLNDRPDE